MNDNKRLFHTMNSQMEKLLLEKRDTEQFLKIIAPKYMGVYVLDRNTDTFRDIVGPLYFRSVVNHEKGKYSASIKAYCDKYVSENFHSLFDKVLDYDYVYKQLHDGKIIREGYRKKDGTLVKLTIQRYSSNDFEDHLSIWIFTNEDSVDAIFGSLEEARWSIEFDTNKQAKEIHWNKSACALLGYNEEKMAVNIQKDPFLLLHPEDEQRTSTAITNILHRNVSNFDVDHRLQTKSGEYRWYRSIGKAIYHPDGSIASLYGFIIDIDEQKTT